MSSKHKDDELNDKHRLDETPNQFRYRAKDPSLFQKGSFRTKKLDTKGISIIVGRLEGKTTTTVQAYHFDKADGWTRTRTIAWIRRNVSDTTLSYEFDGEEFETMDLFI